MNDRLGIRMYFGNGSWDYWILKLDRGELEDLF